MCKPNKIHLSFSVITREFIGPLLGGTITELTDFQSSSMVINIILSNLNCSNSFILMKTFLVKMFTF